MKTIPQIKREVRVDERRKENDDVLQKIIRSALVKVKLDGIKFFSWKRLP